MNGKSELESIYVDVPADGYYCVAVWKKEAGDLSKNGKYELSFVPGATDAPSTPTGPVVTALTSIYPNPFNPRTTVAFDLAVGGSVQIGVYNLRGELVRTLVDESRPAGRHEVRWDGVDQSGRQVASGTYFARLVAGGKEQRRKMLLLK
jgi:hypothetical protein